MISRLIFYRLSGIISNVYNDNEVFMQKVFFKAIINTLVGIFAAAVITWAVVTLAFPSTLITPTANMGWTRVSAWYAASSYVRTKDLNDLALAVDMSINVVATKKGKIALGENVTISQDEYKQVVKYCSILVRQDDFEAFCTERDEEEAEKSGVSAEEVASKDYYYTSLVEAYYNTGYRTESLARALLALEESTSGLDGTDAITILITQSAQANDVDFCKLIKKELVNLNLEQTDKYVALIGILNGVTGETDGIADEPAEEPAEEETSAS